MQMMRCEIDMMTRMMCSMMRIVTPLPWIFFTISIVFSTSVGFRPAKFSSRRSSFRLRGESARHLEALPHAERKAAGRDVAPRFHLGEGRRLERHLLRLVAVVGPGEGRDHHVLEDGQAREGLDDLERPGETEPADLVRLQPVDPLPLEEDRAVRSAG